MEAKKINLKGIVRKPQNRASEDGNCAEVVNLRNWDGAWETVGDKEQIEELESGATQVTFHPINEQYEAYAYRLGTDIKAKIIDKVQGTSTVKTLFFDIDSKVIMKPFYNVLLVSIIDGFNLASFIFNTETGDYFPGISSIKDNLFQIKYLRSIDRIIDIDTDNHLDYYIPKIEVDSEGNIISAEYNWYTDETTIISFNNAKEAIENLNVAIGSVYIQLTLTLSNGAEIPIGAIQRIRTGEIYVRKYFEPVGTGGVYYAVFQGEVHFYYIELTQECMNILNSDNKSLFSMINVYMSRPVAVELRDDSVRAGESHYDFLGADNIGDISTMKKVGSYNLRADNTSNQSFFYPYEPMDYYYLLTDNKYQNIYPIRDNTDYKDVVKIIPVYDSLDDGKDEMSTLHNLTALNNMSNYNERLLMAGIGVNLFSGNDIKSFVSDILSSDVNKIYSQTDPTLVILSGTSTEPVYNRAVTTSSYYYLSIYYTIDTDKGMKTVKSDEIQLNYFDPDDNNQIAFALQNVQYPDSRAIEYTVVLRIPASGTSLTEDGYYSETRKLKKHDFLDLAFDDDTYVIRHTYPTTETSPSQLTGDTLSNTTQLPLIDTTYKDLNRVQASATGTVFSFPAKYSYRIGMDEVMNVTSITDEMSQGQFGQFPLIAFTKGMIWAMEIGQGDVFISNIVPLANEVCNSPDTITVVRGGILFSTTEGLKILQGKQVNEISEAIEGAISRLPIVGKFTLNTILERNNLTSSVDETSFKEFLNGARIGYNYYHDELILSSDAKDYSYLFSMKTGVWTKIMEKFDSFVNQFPHNYGLKGSLVYDLSKESKTGPKITLIATRPFKLTPDTYKKIEQVIVRGEFQTASGYLFGCTEGSDYRLISSGAASETIKQLYLHRTPYSAKTFILVIAANMEPGDYISEIDVMFNDRFTNKLR